eukprot:353493-Chlamydomonas_euryale.AAC.4
MRTCESPRCVDPSAQKCGRSHPCTQLCGSHRIEVWPSPPVRPLMAASMPRPAGVSARDANRDSTAFERARAEWGKATVSARGKVGGGGDGKSSNWLG